MIKLAQCLEKGCSRGLTLLEITVTLGVLSVAMAITLQTMQVMSSGVHSGIAQSDNATKANGTIYDIVTELRQATAYSPNFSIQQDITLPPSITFDLVAGVDSTGNILWGNKVTYALQLMPDPEYSLIRYLQIDAGQLIRTETDSLGNSTVTLAQDFVPYRYSENGVTNWGFTVNCTGNAISLSISRFADAGVGTGHSYQNASDASYTSPNVAITQSSGIYFLRNPQSITTLN